MHTDMSSVSSVEIRVNPRLVFGSACGPVIVPVFKTGGRQVSLSPVGSTPTRFRHFLNHTRIQERAVRPAPVIHADHYFANCAATSGRTAVPSTCTASSRFGFIASAFRMVGAT